MKRTPSFRPRRLTAAASAEAARWARGRRRSRLIHTVAACCALFLLSLANAQEQPTLDQLLDLAPPPAPESSNPEPGTPESPPSDTTPAGGDPAPGDPADATEAGAGDSVLTEAVRRQLEQQEAADAFAQAVRDMARVAGQLDDADPGIDTQRLQESILERLDQAIASAESQQSSSSSSSSSAGQPGGPSSNQDNQSGNDPAAAPGPPSGDQAGARPGDEQRGSNPDDGGFSPGQVGPVDPTARGLDELRREWGNLPPRLRDELTNGLDEPYSPVYRELTERYYRRLAEEANQ